MFYFLNKLSGHASLEIKADMPERFLNNCTARGLRIISAQRIDLFTIVICLPSSMISEAKGIAVKSNCELTVLGLGRKWIKNLRKRIFPVICTFFIIGLVFWSKFYVWEIEIKGNETVTDSRILEVLAECGVESGAFWPGFSADNIRSEVLYRIPELSWITVNMHGSLAEVTAVERREKPEMHYQGECSNIVADKDAFVTQVNILAGQAQVKPGCLVNKGDILISGVVESTYSSPRFLRSMGSVQGETNMEIIALMPESELVRHYTGEKNRRFALIIGNKRINFYSGSSISDSFCDKIISVWNMGIEDLLSLPVSLVCETLSIYELLPVEMDDYNSGQYLERSLRDSLLREIGEGELISEKLSFAEERGLLIGSLRVRCREDIGVSVPISESQKLDSQMKYIQKADDQ